MKYIFIINPAAGQGKARSFWLPQIQKLVKERELPYELHNTLSFQEGVNYIRQRCETGEEIRFYGCGGDGTLNCLVNGAFGYPNASVGVLPTGTGNDFVRSFFNSQQFRSLDAQVDGTVCPVDVIRCTDARGSQIAVNMCNIGVDAAVVDVAQEMKKKPLIRGPLAYGASVVKVLSGRIGFPVRLQFDDGDVVEEEALLVAIGNGGFCGGGFHATPQCSVSDGLMDVCLIRNIPKRKIARLILKYRAGTHVTDRECQQVITYRKCRKLQLTPLLSEDENQEWMAVDGEIAPCLDTGFEILPGGVNFIVPQGCEMR